MENRRETNAYRSTEVMKLIENGEFMLIDIDTPLIKARGSAYCRVDKKNTGRCKVKFNHGVSAVLNINEYEEIWQAYSLDIVEPLFDIPEGE